MVIHPNLCVAVLLLHNKCTEIVFLISYGNLRVCTGFILLPAKKKEIDLYSRTNYMCIFGRIHYMSEHNQ